jgi:hypothetical protein
MLDEGLVYWERYPRVAGHKSARVVANSGQPHAGAQHNRYKGAARRLGWWLRLLPFSPRMNR